MANMTLNSYIHQLQNAWDEYDGKRLSELLSVKDAHCLSSQLARDDMDDIDGIISKLGGVIESPLLDMVELHLRTIFHVHRREYERALGTQSQLGQVFSKMFGSQKDENWQLDMMEVIVEDLRKIAKSAGEKEDVSAAIEEGTPTRLEKAADILMALFRICAADTRTQEKDTKRWGMMPLVNHLFKIYFSINRLSLCKPLIRAIEALPFRDRFPNHQLVMYNYFVGRKAMFDSEFTNSAECLSYAYKHSTSKENRKKILTYLIPVKMFLGWLPTPEVIEKYKLQEYTNIAVALKEGNVKRFHAAMDASESKFIKFGIYLILEKLQMQLFRTLIKKVAMINGTHQIPISMIEAALRYSGYEEIDNDETHCIVANLIFDGHIRGYVSLQHQVLVVAKQNAFPKMVSNTD